MKKDRWFKFTMEIVIVIILTVLACWVYIAIRY